MEPRPATNTIRSFGIDSNSKNVTGTNLPNQKIGALPPNLPRTQYKLLFLCSVLIWERKTESPYPDQMCPLQDPKRYGSTGYELRSGGSEWKVGFFILAIWFRIRKELQYKPAANETFNQSYSPLLFYESLQIIAGRLVNAFVRTKRRELISVIWLVKALRP